MPVSTDHVRLPPDVGKGLSISLVPSLLVHGYFTPILNGASYIAPTGDGLDQFAALYTPIFDLSVYADQVLDVQPQARYDAAGSGITWRDVGAVILTPASSLFTLTGSRFANRLIRYVFTNNAGADCTVTEIVIIARSMA